ncbi:hypothetical protein HDU67_006957 [Dinochytrium kinnereticum]|nr:hypothetical protein HDU67_006957 [Dinochytrium kinnereticum]
MTIAINTARPESAPMAIPTINPAVIEVPDDDWKEVGVAMVDCGRGPIVVEVGILDNVKDLTVGMPVGEDESVGSRSTDSGIRPEKKLPDMDLNQAGM